MKPHVKHLHVTKRVFGYLKKHMKMKGQIILVDLTYRNHKQYTIEEHRWDNLYLGIKEDMPDKTPELHRKKAQIMIYVDTDHTVDTVTQRSVAGIFVFTNKISIRWYCKCQRTVKTSTYGSELVETRVAADMILDLLFLLRMFGVPLDDPVFILGDNMSVNINMTRPSLQLKKTIGLPF